MTEYFIFCDKCGKYIIGSKGLCDNCSKEKEKGEEKIYLIDIYKTLTTNSY